MKITDRELNNILDDAAGEIRNENLDAGVVAGATERVWSRLSGQQMAAQAGVAMVDQIRNCDDFQALIPVYLQGGLSAARTMLLEDHTRECVPCRKALKEARYGNQSKQQLETQQARAAAVGYRMTVLRWGIAAALVAAVGLGAWPWVQRFINSASTLNAIVEASNGSVYKVTNDRTQTVKVGERLLRGERIRTAKNAGAVVKLPDGTRIEMRERAEFSVTDNPAGVTINLDRGQVIVQAAKQRDRKLFVQTDDSLVSVKGTIFSVNSGTKGARVSVIEGEVHVDHAGRNDVLLPGQQVTTHESIERVAVKEEIAWSRDAGRYTQMLDEVRAQIEAAVAMPGNRYSTRLLDSMPENTVIYVAIPNITETLAKANQILQENLQQNAELRQWWEKEQAQGRHRQGFNETIELIRQFGAHLGDEVVLAATSKQNGEPNEPVIIAEVKDPAGLRALIESKLGATGPQRLRIIDDPSAIGPETRDAKTLNLWMNDGVVAFSPEGEALKQLAGRIRSQAKPFAASPFRNHIAGLYREGAGLIIAADLERLVMNGLKKEKESAAIQQLGVTDLRYFVVELKEKDGKPYNRAVVNFKESQHGITSWLAAPNPMGALEFISPDANVVAAFVVQEPTALVDDLLNTLKTADPKAYDELIKFQAEQGVDLRNDFAGPLGSEYAFAVDGPILPTPSWKAVFQVDDPTRLQQSLEHLVEKLNVEFAKHGKQGLAWTRVEIGGKPFYTLKSLDLAVAEVNYAYAYGYLIAAPSRALVENAIKFKESGYTLLQSAKFKATLPEDKQANFSAMLYQNTSSLTAPLAKVVGNAGASKEARGMMKGLLGNKAGLAYVYALKDRMVFSVNTEDGPLSLSPADLLGLPGNSGMGQIFRHATR
ncbi:MAG: FecR domain-containing protein [Blastocatellia bacterium]|nr:FecR domain-containing protein [Blastocatellia bacterium]